MIEGTLIAESLRLDTTLEGFPLRIRQIHRGRAVLSPEQAAAGLPPVGTVIGFEMSEEQHGPALAGALSRSLEPHGWYVHFQSAAESFIIFPGRVFRYLHGNPAGRAQAQAHGRQWGIPEAQLDWTV